MTPLRSYDVRGLAAVGARGAASLVGCAMVLAALPVATRLVYAQEATRASSGGAQCVLEDAVELGRTTDRGIAVTVAYASPGRGMVAWSADSEHLASRSLEDATLSSTHTLPFAHAHDLKLLAGVRTDYVALTAVTLCNSMGNSCFQAHGLRADGTRTGPPLEERPSGQDARVDTWVRAPDGVVVGQNSRWGPADIARYTLQATGEVTVRVIGSQQGECAGGPGFAVIAARGQQVYALGAAESDCGEGGRRRLTVLPGDAQPVVRGLPQQLSADRLLIDDAGAWLVFHVGGAGARIAHLRPDGTFSERPRTMRASPPPAPLADLVVPTVTVRGSTIALRRSDAAGRAIGEPVVISNARATAIETAVAFSGTDFVVVYALRQHDGWHVWLRRARCA
jgi:hypothetical protein